MTFPEAGIQILERAGRPMHFQEIAQKAIAEGLLSHVGQIPDDTMRERLVALARRSSDRKLLVVGPGQFALTDWGLPEDEQALAEMDSEPARPDDKPLRDKERHPPLQKAVGGRSEGGRERDRDRDRKKKKRLPPLSVVVAEILGEVGASADLETLLAKGRERGQMSDELSRDTLLSALNEENRRRAKTGGGPVFEIVDSDIKLLSTEALTSLRSLEEGEVRDLAVPTAERPASDAHLVLDARRQTARQLKRRLSELSSAGLDKLAILLLTKSGYKDARPVSLPAAERERLYVARRRLGLTELRFLVQVLPTGREATRESVQQLRSLMVEAEAHAGLVIGPGEATREARAESQRLGLPLLTLLCSEAFIEELVLREVGVITYEASVTDDLFWRGLRRGSERDEGEKAPREGREPREAREKRRPPRGPRSAPEATQAPSSEASPSSASNPGSADDAGAHEISMAPNPAVDAFLAGEPLAVVQAAQGAPVGAPKESEGN